LRDPNAEAIETHTLAVLVDNERSVLARVIGLFFRPRRQHRKPDGGGGRPSGAFEPDHRRDQRARRR